MRVSTKGRYALRMMIEFGLNPDQCTKISQVAARQGISDKYLESILKSLVKQKMLCPEYPRRTGRLYAYQKAGGIYSRHDPARCRRKPCSGLLPG